MSPKTYFTRRR